jgi:PKD repeat protein
VGALLLVTVVTLSASAYGAIYLGEIDDGSDSPVVDVSADVTPTEATLYHEAGDSVDGSSLRVRLRVNGTEWTNVTWASGNVSGTADGRFGEGESWTWDDGNFSAGATVGILLADNATETVLFRGTRVVEGTGAGGAVGAGGPGPSPPTAAFDADPSTVATGETVAFDASASDDPDGGSLTYQWTFGDGGTDTGETPTHSYADDGSYDATLTVTDDEGQTASTTRTVAVTNRPPDASFTPSSTSVETGETVTVDAITSGDPDGTIESYEWDFGDGTTGSGEMDGTTYASAGIYDVTLTVTDGDGATATATETITVTEPADSTKPVIEAFDTTDTSKTGGNPKYAQFDVSWTVSDDVELGSVELTLSRFGEVDSASPNVGGTSASGPTTLRGPEQNSNPSGQTYTVTITVTDAAGNTESRSTTVTVSGGGGPPECSGPPQQRPPSCS